MPPRIPPTPTEATLHEAALTHLARFSATEAGLRRVLERRIMRWARATGAEADAVAPLRRAAAAIAARLVQAGAVDDAAFAAARARRLGRAGRSRRAIAAHLAAKGVDAETAGAALPDDPATELAAAAAFARRRRLGPFAAADADRQKALAAFARAGFGAATAHRALALDREEAEDLIRATSR